MVAPLAFLADQITKIVARARLPVDASGYGIRVPVIENHFDWVLAYNTGSAFSLFHGVGAARIFLTVIGLFAVSVVIWLIKRAGDHETWMVAALSLMVGGAAGNLVERILFGKVTDFILWRYHEHTWPVFNIADACLAVAVVLFLVTSFATARRQRAAERAGQSAPAS